MKILASIHLYPPVHNCGGEYMLHNTLKYLLSRGHDIRVLHLNSGRYGISKVYTHEGIDVFPANPGIAERLFMWADMVFTHLDFTQWTIGMASVYRKPVVHLIHNTHKYESIVNARGDHRIVYNSEWARQQLGYAWPSMVMHPPVDWRRYDVDGPHDCITLINLDGNKGGHILRQIAERMPDKKFIGVKGSYSEPLAEGQHTNQPANVEVLNNTPDILPVYRRTRVLIMPSKYESWGMTATEAMCSGIPVISSGTPGLRENCGDAGIYVDRDDIDGWVMAIKKLDDPKEYKRASAKATHRSRQLDPIHELAQLESWLRK
jgi:glycosyltransferase involved in cell wall biosynthesis